MSSAGAERRQKPISCLLVDDSRFDRQRLRRIAEQTSIALNFTEAGNVDEAITALRARHYDLILLDQKLPDGEGTALVALLKKHLGNDAPPIIMISGSEEAAMPARAFASGCTDFIGKDNLSIPALEKMITATVVKSRAAMPRTSMPMAEHQEALKSFADDTVVELRIPLARMLRVISRIADKYPPIAAEFADLKLICREMWDYLDSVSQSVAQPPQ